jgi:two-component system, chemotaxis family, chemotaxis protein CheY
MKPLKVLLVDDDDLIRQLIVHWLSRKGHEVLQAENGNDATKLLTENRVDLLITDISMPDCDGLELIARARRIQPGARVMAISGGGRFLQRFPGANLAGEMGVDVVMIKPFSCAQLGDVIESTMGCSRDSVAKVA